jgi:hypothetical protein
VDELEKSSARKLLNLPETKNIPIFCIYKDNNGELWLGTHENRVLKFNGKSFEKYNF